jgi:phage portal protein BeeE
MLGKVIDAFGQMLGGSQQPIEKLTDTTSATRQFSRIAVPPAGPGRDQQPAPWPNNRNEYVENFKGATYIAVAANARRIAMQEAQIFVRHVKRSGVTEEPLKPTHRIYELLERVNPFHTQYDLWFYHICWRLITGDSYTWKVRNGMGLPVELWPLPSQWVWVVPSETKFIGGYLAKSMFGGRDKMIPCEDMIHIMEPGIAWNGSGRFYGYAPSAAGAMMIDLEVQMLQQLWHRFKNFAPPGLIFSPDKDVMPGGFDEEKMLDIYQWVATQHALAAKSYRPMVMPSGVKVDNVSPTPKEMDYGTSLEKALEYILAIFSTPKAAVGMVADFNKNNYQAAMMAWGENMLNPLLTHMGQHLTQDLAHEYDDRLVVRFPKIDAKDLMVIAKFMEMMLRFGVTELDEVRAAATELGIAKLPPTGRKLVPQQRSEEQPNQQVTQQPEAVQKSHEGNGNGRPANRLFPQNDRDIALLSKRIGDIQSNVDTVCDRMMTAVRETVQGNLAHATEQQSARLEHTMDVVKQSLEEVATNASTDLSGIKDLIVRSGTEHGLAAQITKSLDGFAESIRDGLVEAAKSIEIPGTEVHNEIEIPEIDLSLLKAETPQVTVNVEPTPVNITNEVDVPETNVTVKGIAGPQGKAGPRGPKGDRGTRGADGKPSKVDVTVEQSKPSKASIEHSDGSKSTVELS